MNRKITKNLGGSMNRKNCVGELEIGSGAGLIWLECGDVGFNTRLIVGAGCGALVSVDGVVQSYGSGESVTLNPKGFIKSSKGKNWRVYGVNKDKKIKVWWGFGFKDFKDEELFGGVIGVRARGCCTISIASPISLLESFAGFDKIDEDMVCGSIKDTVMSCASNAFDSYLSNLSGHSSIGSSVELFCDKVVQNVDNEIRGYGLRADKCEIEPIEFNPTYHKFIDLVNQGKVEQLKTDIVAQQTKQAGMAVDIVNKFKDNKGESDDV